MKKIEDACIGCPPEKGCLGENCPNYKPRIVYYCDSCGVSINEMRIYRYGKKHYCSYCLLEQFEEITD